VALLLHGITFMVVGGDQRDMQPFCQGYAKVLLKPVVMMQPA
jgi:hypothetical protein